jgi:hypothetical protein
MYGMYGYGQVSGIGIIAAPIGLPFAGCRSGGHGAMTENEDDVSTQHHMDTDRQS